MLYLKNIHIYFIKLIEIKPGQQQAKRSTWSKDAGVIEQPAVGASISMDNNASEGIGREMSIQDR